MSGGFKGSGRFGLIGVFVVAALVAVIAGTTGQGEASPKLTLALIFGVIAIFIVVLRGWTVLSGQRHGRAVEVWLGGHEDAGTSEVSVGAPGPEFDARARDGRVRAANGTPAAVAAALESVPPSERWKRLEVSGGPEGIAVTRKKGQRSDWLCDLWLAEHLAPAAARAGGA